jgi:hypothetical protein
MYNLHLCPFNVNYHFRCVDSEFLLIELKQTKQQCINSITDSRQIVDTFYHRIEEICPRLCFITIFFVVLISILIIVWRGMCYFLASIIVSSCFCNITILIEYLIQDIIYSWDLFLSSMETIRQ